LGLRTEEKSITGNDTEKGSAAYEELFCERDAEASEAVTGPDEGEDAGGGAAAVAGVLDGGGA